VASDAMTPDAATEQWQVCDVISKAWQDAPKTTTRICTGHERQAVVRQAEEEAMAKAKEAPAIVLDGQGDEEPHHCMMGAYELMEGELVSGKGVWQRKGTGQEAHLHYAASSRQWWVGDIKADMEAGKVFGEINVASDAMTPDAATEQLQVWGNHFLSS
jgi:hypothetical protein